MIKKKLKPFDAMVAHVTLVYICTPMSTDTDLFTDRKRNL
jgi:hypothetical protein